MILFDCCLWSRFHCDVVIVVCAIDEDQPSAKMATRRSMNVGHTPYRPTRRYVHTTYVLHNSLGVL